MRIKMKTNMAGPAGAFQSGDELVIDDKEGRQLVAGGYAEELKPKARPAAAKGAAKDAADKTPTAKLADGPAAGTA